MSHPPEKRQVAHGISSIYVGMRASSGRWGARRCGAWPVVRWLRERRRFDIVSWPFLLGGVMVRVAGAYLRRLQAAMSASREWLRGFDGDDAHRRGANHA